MGKQRDGSKAVRAKGTCDQTTTEGALHDLADTFTRSGWASDGDGPRSLTCREADALADLFEVGGYSELAEVIRAAHAEGDEAGDAHYTGEDGGAS